jgi:hypothetical protein
MDTIIHHYTTVENLSLILRSRKLRFTRLDKVDDIREIEGLPFEFSTYVFVSCWTYQKEESIPLWKMYTQNMRGVKISMPINMFHKTLIKAGKYENNINIEGDLDSLLSLDQLITDNCIVVNAHNNEKSFYKNVIYDNKYPDYYKKSVYNFNNETRINDLFIFGKYKSEIWEFQKESRFTLYIIPLLPLNHPLINGEKKLQYENLNLSVLNHIQNKNEYYDLQLNEDTLRKIEITLGPLSVESDRIIVESLLSTFAKDAKLKPSNLTGCIRK